MADELPMAETAADQLQVEMTLPNHALVWATCAHAEMNQVRKYTGEPYITHPIAVMMILKNLADETDAVVTDEMLAAALLHDVIEDTFRNYVEVRRSFGETVANMVLELTDQEQGNRATRKFFAKQRLSMASADVQTIKLADLIDNTSSIVEHDPKFAATYLAEKRDLLTVLTKGNAHLRMVARQQVDDGLQELARKGFE